MPKKQLLNKKAFTMVELLAVIVILGLLLTIAIPAINKQLAAFRVNYYTKLETSVKSAGEDYITDKKYAKPTKLLYSKVIKVSELEDEKYIDEVEDYLGNKCDNTDTSYSYVVVVKTGEKTYDYTACLKCSEDEYATDTSGEENDYCNSAWLTNDFISYDYSYDSETLYVYYGTKEEEIKEQVGLTYDTIKKDNKGNTLATVSGDDDVVYPQNINELVGKNVNSIVTLKYTLPNGTELTKNALIYKHNAPKITMTYTNGNSTTGKSAGATYTSGEWSNGVNVTISFSDSDISDLFSDDGAGVKISKVEYYDSSTSSWKNTGCTVSTSGTSCSWIVESDFNQTVKFRITNNNGFVSDESNEVTIRVDVTKPTCTINSTETIKKTSQTATLNCTDSSSGMYKYYWGNSSSGTPSENMTSGTNYSKTVDSANKYYLIAYDKAGNLASFDKTYYSYTIRIMKQKASGTATTYKTSDYDTDSTSSDYIAPSGTTLTHSDFYSSITGFNYKGYSTGSTSTSTSLSTSKTLTLSSSIYINYWFARNTYTIAFNSNGGTGTTSSVSCTYGVNCTLTSNGFSKTGYTFNGWNTKSDGSGTSYNNGASVSNLTSTNGDTVTLYAKWTANTYTIAFNSNGGSGTTSSVSCTYGQNCTLTSNGFSRTGYTFNGWNTKSDGSGTSYSNGASVSNLTSTNSGTVTLYAKWKANTYTIAFNSNGGSGTTSSVSCTYGQNCTLTSNGFSRTGYTFNGWNTKSDGSGTSYSNGASVSNLTSTSGGTVTLYAKWKANNCTISYVSNVSTTVTYMPSSTTVSAGNTIYVSDLIPITSSKGFSGWTYNSKTYDPGSSLGTCNGGTYTLTASWSTTVGKYPDVKLNIGYNAAKDYATTDGSNYSLYNSSTLNYQNQTTYDVCEVTLSASSTATKYVNTSSSSDRFHLKIYAFVPENGAGTYKIQWCTGTDPSTQCGNYDVNFSNGDSDYLENGGYANSYWGISNGKTIGHQVSYVNNVSGYHYFRVRAANGSTYSDWSPIYSAYWSGGNSTQESNTLSNYCS